MANPQVSPGTINLLQTSVTVPSFTGLNVTPSYLGSQMVTLSLEGEMTKHHRAAVGVVTSPQVYLVGTVTIALLKSQSLAALYKAQWESNTLLGDIVVRPDTTVLPPFDMSQVGIVDVREMTFDGNQPEMVVTLRGQYPINADLWP